MLRWIGRLCVIKKRVQGAWMDLMPQYTMQSHAFQYDFGVLQGRSATQLNEQEAFEEWLGRESRKHMNSFPINDNLFALMVTVQADLSE